MKSGEMAHDGRSGCVWATLPPDQFCTKLSLWQVQVNVWLEGFFLDNLLKKSVIGIEMFFVGTKTGQK